MLSGFAGEFLILSGTMLTTAAHHVAWTVVATTGVILSAAYMLTLIQRVFYGSYGLRPEEVTTAPDLSLREHAELWPLAFLFLVMGLCSPYWMRAIDAFSTATIAEPQRFEPSGLRHMESETYAPTTVEHTKFVDPTLGAAAQGKPAPAVNNGARY
jgi:NADH-quinone oxidoreductase subunit M